MPPSGRAAGRGLSYALHRVDVTEASLLRRQLEIGAFMLAILVSAAVATVLVPRTYLPRYFAAWMLFLLGRSIEEVGAQFGRDVGSNPAGSAAITLVHGVALFVFGHLVFLGFLSSDWSLFAAAAAGLLAALYTLTGDLDEEHATRP